MNNHASGMNTGYRAWVLYLVGVHFLLYIVAVELILAIQGRSHEISNGEVEESSSGQCCAPPGKFQIFRPFRSISDAFWEVRVRHLKYRQRVLS